MRILISGGGTREPIDGVRFITNFSTGATAAALADYFVGQGHEVVGLFGEGAIQPSRLECRLKPYSSFQDLDAAFQSVLAEEEFDAVLHLAAVSDYSVAEIRSGGRSYLAGEAGKLDSQGEVTITLKPNHKIVQRIWGYAKRARPKVVAFKLTNGASGEERLAAVEKLRAGSDAEWIVHNDLGDRRAGRNLFTVYRGTRVCGSAREPLELGRLLEELLGKAFGRENS